MADKSHSPSPPPRDGRKTRAMERRSKRKRAILKAARRVFSERGYHRSSVSHIIEGAGIARGTFYLYFPSKRAVFEELLEHMFAEIDRAVFRIRTDDPGDPPLDQIYRNVLGVVTVLEQHRELTIILLREAVGLDPTFDHKLEAFYERLARMIQDALTLGQHMGLVREGDTRLVAYCVLGSIKEVIVRMLRDDTEPTRDREQVARAVLDYNLRGLIRPGLDLGG